MRGWWWAVGFLLVAVAVEGFLFKLHEAGVLSALERWRQRPRAVVITLIEIALLLTAAGLFSTTSGWAAVAWAAAGFAIAALLIWTTHLILRTPAREPSALKPQSAKLEPAGPPPKVRQPYIWVRPVGQQWPLHGVPVVDGVPQPRAYCGYEYDSSDNPNYVPVVWIPEYYPKYQTCETCRTAMVSAGYFRR